jgi:hypothetical protein
LEDGSISCPLQLTTKGVGRKGDIQELHGFGMSSGLSIRRAMLLVRLGGLEGSGTRDELVTQSGLVAGTFDL